MLHGVERMTPDLDLSIDMTKSNVNKFLEIMEELGLSPRVPRQRLQWLSESGKFWHAARPARQALKGKRRKTG
ncbi:MAG: hypothetical protein GF398_10555 [Chitinivibrionales bacterium]|nr:hypothetical protein [Chitinivibrionales bacterium]